MAVLQIIDHMFLIDCHLKPTKSTTSSIKYIDKCLTCYFFHYSYQNFPSCREKSIRLGFIMPTVSVAQSTLDEQRKSDLIQIILLFCLHSCEYTKNQLPQEDSTITAQGRVIQQHQHIYSSWCTILCLPYSLDQYTLSKHIKVVSAVN